MVGVGIVAGPLGNPVPGTWVVVDGGVVGWGVCVPLCDPWPNRALERSRASPSKKTGLIFMFFLAFLL
jgi:hypothetical protein